MKNLKSSKEQIEEKDYELEDILSASCVHEEMFENQQVETIKWRSLADDLAEALKNIGDHEGTLLGGEEALARYEAMKKGE